MFIRNSMNNNKTLYSIETCTVKEVREGRISIDDIISDNKNGFIVSDFLSEKEVASLLKGFRNLQDTELIHIDDSFDSYPMSFAQFDQMVESGVIKSEDYFSRSENFISNFSAEYGVDIIQKLGSLFGSVTNAPPIEIPKNETSKERYVPFTFRELFPGEGCLKAHCENLFFQEFPGFFDKINKFSSLKNQLSFFIVLQKPESGGELTLFDIIWDGKQKRPNDDEIIVENGTHYKFEDEELLRRDYFNPEVGSLVVFSGGKIWHRVEKVKLAPSRITLGGFLSFSHDGKTLCAWS